MREGPYIAEIASLIGDPARANILGALMAGRALSASELAAAAGVTAQTTSAHLARLTTAGLLVCRPEGRRRYFELSSPAIAELLETLSVVAGPSAGSGPPGATQALREARFCYDHLAGKLGVAIFRALVDANWVALPDGQTSLLTAEGRKGLANIGVDLDRNTRRTFCRTCMDWSEREPHLAGQVGAALADWANARRWIRRAPIGRTIYVTSAGKAGFYDLFGLSWPP